MFFSIVWTQELHVIPSTLINTDWTSPPEGREASNPISSIASLSFSGSVNEGSYWITASSFLSETSTPFTPALLDMPCSMVLTQDWQVIPLMQIFTSLSSSLQLSKLSASLLSITLSSDKATSRWVKTSTILFSDVSKPISPMASASALPVVCLGE